MEENSPPDVVAAIALSIQKGEEKHQNQPKEEVLQSYAQNRQKEEGDLQTPVAIPTDTAGAIHHHHYHAPGTYNVHHHVHHYETVCKNCNQKD